MKKLVILVTALIVMASVPAVQAAPDITDLLKGALGGGNSGDDKGGNTALSGLQGLVEGLISKSNLTEADLVGSWKYNKPAVAFKSSDLLKKAGGAAASGVIVEKLSPYYDKAGINNLTAVFNNDGTFKFQLRRGALSGTYAKDADSENGDFIFQFKAAGKIPLGQFKAQVENSIASVSGQSTLKSVASMLNSYDGLNCGFELTKVK